MKRIGVLLAGSGVFDGSEIHEATLSLLAIDEADAEAVCFAPNKDQYHVINHLNGDELNEKRNVLTESARIARGDISDLADMSASQIDALLIPGGFGAAKNLNQWALSGPDGSIDSNVKVLITDMVKQGKPIGAVCMGPTVLAKAFEGQDIDYTLTVGTTEESSPYDIKGISEGIESLGGQIEMKTNSQISTDLKNKIVTGPCYMMDASISDIRKNTKMVVDKLIDLI